MIGIRWLHERYRSAVLLEGRDDRSSMDSIRAIGTNREVLRRRFVVEVADGVLDMSTRRNALLGALSALEVIPAGREYCDAYRATAEEAIGGQRSLADAVRFFDSEAKTHPDRPEAHHLLGELLLRSGRPTEAVAALRRSLEVDGRRVGTWIRLGDSLRGAGEFTEAFQRDRETLARFGYEPPARFWASLAVSSRNALDDADLLAFWKGLIAGRRQDSPAWEYEAFFREQAALGTAVRINCGGERAEGEGGVVFEHDRAYSGGRLWFTASKDVSEPYRTARWETQPIARGGGGSFEYRIPLRRGRYQVRLHFASPLRSPRTKGDLLLAGTGGEAYLVPIDILAPGDRHASPKLQGAG